MRGSSARTWISSPSIGVERARQGPGGVADPGGRHPARPRLGLGAHVAQREHRVVHAREERVAPRRPRVLLAQVVVRRLHARVLHDLDRLRQRATVHAQPHLVGAGRHPRRRQRFERCRRGPCCRAASWRRDRAGSRRSGWRRRASSDAARRRPPAPAAPPGAPGSSPPVAPGEAAGTGADRRCVPAAGERADLAAVGVRGRRA